jgi:hypothetical protein
VYVTGHTASKNFPTTPNAYDTTYNGSQGPNYGDDLFVSKLDNGLSSVLASTYLGGKKWENATTLAVSGTGGVYVAGSTSSSDYPTTPGALDTVYGGGTKYAGDLMISRLDGDLAVLEASTYLGGSGEEGGYSVSLALKDGGEEVYITGFSSSADFPCTQGAYDEDFNGGDGDVIVSRLDGQLSADPFLSTDTEEISVSGGGTAVFSLKAGAEQGERNYLLLGSITGTQPGTTLPGGVAVLPLNWDLFTNTVIAMLNGPVFSEFLGQLSVEGTAEAILNLPPVSGATGLTMHFAYALNGPWDFASNAVGIDLVP